MTASPAVPTVSCFVTDRELFGTVRVRRPKAMRRVVPRDILERLTAGDLVVHIDHGVARYEQMLRRGSGSGDERDFLELSFAAGDRIFVPVEQIARVTRYAGGERPQLSKLGGTEWLRTKQRVRKAVGILAEELLALYAARASAQGHAFGSDTPWQQEMEASFPYEETLDQLARDRRGQARHGGRPPDGPARRGRRRLRQDRGRDPGGVQGDPGRHARWRSSCRRRSSRRSTTRRSRSGSPPSRSRSACCPGSCRRRSRGAPWTASRPVRWTSSSGRTGCSRRTSGSRTSDSSSSTRSSVSGSRPRNV